MRPNSFDFKYRSNAVYFKYDAVFCDVLFHKYKAELPPDEM
jgi:hypothetical protein